MRLLSKMLIFCLTVAMVQSCVSKKKYDELAAAKEATDQALAETQANLKTLQEEKDALAAEMESEKARLNSEISSIKSDLDATKSQMAQVNEKLTMTEKELSDLKSQINGIFGAYQNSGLSMEERDGRLYVVTSTPAKFRSGSAYLNKDQRNAIAELAETLKANPELKILVEGHTDTDKMKEGAAYSDNWDLSVARAMTVVRRLIREGVNPNQLTVAGHGETMPAASNDSSDGKATNRRTDITPNPALGDLMKKGN